MRLITALQIVLTTSLISMSAQALDIYPHWSMDFKKFLVVNCQTGEEKHCQKLCGAATGCLLQEGFCRNCAGTSSLYLKDLLDTLSQVYVNLDQTVSLDTVIEYISTGAFVSLTADTVFNFADTFNSEDLQGRFQRLCNDPTDKPVLFLDADRRTRELKQVNFVLCRDVKQNLVAFKVGRAADIVVTPLPESNKSSISSSSVLH